ncbi:MAG: hypothetical protein M1819_005511 [Sarea resinae]|nr:MAG: hypothetical protein M1819_005511 [Sarea resinae]
MTVEDLPFWLVNVPRDEWPAECPDFLANADARDRGMLATPDAEYHRQTWGEVQRMIKANRIDLFGRVPSQLRKYRQYTSRLKKEYGSVMNFVMAERLRWDTLTPNDPTPFADPADYKILYNDWPYGVDPNIVHLVVWTKFDLEEDPVTTDLTPKARQQIDHFVARTFRTHVDPEHVIWFKNWSSLKSIHAVEHFHVMLYEPDREFIREITKGDVPLSEKV